MPKLINNSVSMCFNLEQKIKLNWLAKIRYCALLGEIGVFFFSIWGLGLNLVYWPFCLILLFGIISNLYFISVTKRHGASYASLVGSVVSIDVILLTMLLYSYGGHTNPFSTMYLVHVTLAAFLLGGAWTWCTFLISSICFASLFFFSVPVQELAMHNHMHGESGFSLHLQGMLLSFLLIGSLVSFFLTRMSAEISGQHENLKLLREKEALDAKLLGLATLSAGAAHELATPIGTVDLIADQILDAHNDDSSIVTDIKDIKSELTRCKIILDKMRGQNSELQGELIEEVEVKDVFEDVAKSLDAMRGRFEFDESITGLKLRTLRKSLVEAISALVKNAIQASDLNAVVRLSAYLNSNHVVFCVQDSGLGFSKRLMTRIGEPFLTTKPIGEGMGLGLFLVKLFAKRVGGGLDIQSSQGLGTKAVLNIPINVGASL